MSIIEKQRENIKYINFYYKAISLKLYYFITIIIALIVAILYRRGGLISSVIYFVATFIIMNFVLDIIVSIYKAKTKRIFTHVISILTGYLSIYNNAIQALKQTAEHINEPFKSTILKNVYAYEAGNISEERFYQNLIKEIIDNNFKELFEILFITNKHGSNSIELLDKLRKSVTETYNLERQIESSSKVSVIIVFIMIYINLTVMYQAIKMPETNALLMTTQGKLFIMINLLLIILALFIVRWMISDK